MTDEQAAEFAAVNAVLKGFEGIVNSKGRQLAATDIRAYSIPAFSEVAKT